MRRPITLLLVLLLAAPTTYARRRAVSHPSAFAIPQLDTIAAEVLRDGVPGLTIAVRKGNAQIVKAWGNTQPGSVYQIASVTKQFTAAAIMRLVEAGKVRTDDKVRKEELKVVVLMNAIDLRTESRATEIAEEVARAAF